MADALRQYQGSGGGSALQGRGRSYEQNIAAFFRERLEFYLRDAQGFAYDVTNAVLAAGADNVVDALARAEAVAKVRGSEDFDAIAASVKRIKNILRQATEAGKWPPAAERIVARARGGQRCRARAGRRNAPSLQPAPPGQSATRRRNMTRRWPRWPRFGGRSMSSLTRSW